MDRVTKRTRSAIMSRIRSNNNKSTELRLRAALVSRGISGWTLQRGDWPGRPDFSFADAKIALFVDGCFWHGCPTCYRRPKSREEYWDKKVARNKKRDKIVGGELQGKGIQVIRIWEHEIAVSPRAAVDTVVAALEKHTRNP